MTARPRTIRQWYGQYFGLTLGELGTHCWPLTNGKLWQTGIAQALLAVKADGRRIGLPFLGTLEKYPFPHVGRALHQFNALVFAGD